MSAQENAPKKSKREAIWTIIGLFLISSISAAYVINFRLKMKQFQITPEQQQELSKQEQEFRKTQTSTGKKNQEQ
ncbi:MAG: hypothetical protein OEV78_04115 [Spirochaetia bacterium]|nr:hypothetical protein [Spirochaetia bacterium]